MNELTRIRDEYARRQVDEQYHHLYSRYNPADIFMLQDREREMLRLLARYLGDGVGELSVLDLGCGDGHQLSKLIGYGFDARKLVGVDLLPHRVETARDKYANLAFTCADGGRLPFSSEQFDLILQFTVFTSILDESLRRVMARDMVRVLKPQGHILWYDYRWNPSNRQTRGIERKEILDLFPRCTFDFRAVTLAPPLVRWLARKSWTLCSVLNALAFLKTHYLVVIRRQD